MAMSFEKKKILGYIAKIESSVVFIEWEVQNQPRGTTPTPSVAEATAPSRGSLLKKKGCETTDSP